MMELSTKGRYATRIMVSLAMEGGDTPMPKRAIAEAESLSADYAEQILIKLKAGGLVRSARGIRGGFVLARPADAITVLDVLESTEGAVSVAPCEKEDCPHKTSCVTRPVWQSVEDTIREMFKKETIGELARKLRAARSNVPVNYTI